MLYFNVEQTCYSIPLDDEFNVVHLDQVDSALGLSGIDTTLDQLEKIDGVSHVEFNGMFGNFVFLRMSVEHDNDTTKEKISSIIAQAKGRYRKDFKDKPYLVYLGSVSASSEEDAAQAFADSVFGNIEWVDDGSFALTLKGSRNCFDHVLADNKNGSFGVYSSN